MPDDDRSPVDASEPSNQQHVFDRQRSSAPQKRGFFDIPQPLKRIFDKFPLVAYDANQLPSRSPKRRQEHILYVFASDDDAKQENASFNPACLKWQLYLKLAGVPFRVVPSNNHASPSGALPFLLPAPSDDESSKPSDPVPSGKMKRWVSAQEKTQKVSEPTDTRYEAYSSLLESSLRRAWLFQLYLNPANAPLLRNLYVQPCSGNPFVQMIVAHQLRDAAQSEISKAFSSDFILETQVVRAFTEAIDALSTLLGDEEWFFGQPSASLFDAGVFSYTHLLLDDTLGWRENALGEQLKRRQNLVQHREKLRNMYF